MLAGGARTGTAGHGSSTDLFSRPYSNAVLQYLLYYCRQYNGIPADRGSTRTRDCQTSSARNAFGMHAATSLVRVGQATVRRCTHDGDRRHLCNARGS